MTAAGEVDAALQTRRALDTTADAAAAEVEAARARLRSAQAVLKDTEAELVSARDALGAARDPLVRLGAPAAGDATLAEAWARLASWAAGQAQLRASDLADARRAAEAADSQRDQVQADFARAEVELSSLRRDETAAAKADQEARTRLDELTSRIAELDELLQSAPVQAELQAQLALLDELEAVAADAGQRLLAARAERADAQRALADLEQLESEARARLSTARDPVVELGAPTADGVGLLAAWTLLADWASDQAFAANQDVAAAKEKLIAARMRVKELTDKLTADLDEGGIEPASKDVTTQASAAVAAAVSQAQAATQRVVERRAEATKLVARREAAQEEQRVAKLLGDLLRSDRFPRWLVSAAVDALVADASANLAGLSGGQFDLVYQDGDFYVIDHTDADSRRSVRTLSGGETFQASLALALALSAQMSALAAAGAARLDSIFLDEGFGTLDPETLEVVATTLETLAQGQRMVGVVTHVSALAERVPVRFMVSRDTRTSTVRREGLAPLAGAG
jgi:exonuclease SbcC